MENDITTPDGRYLVVRGRLWRAANPALPAVLKVSLTRELLAGRRALRAAKEGTDEAALKAARAVVNAAKEGLGKRGPVWWKDGAPDLNRRLARDTPYAAWHDAIARGAGSPAPI